MREIIPLQDRVLIQPEKRKDTSPGGIVLPDTGKRERYCRGQVVAIGEGKRLDSGERAAFDVSIGDDVVYNDYGTTPVGEDENLLLVRSDEILAIVRG